MLGPRAFTSKTLSTTPSSCHESFPETLTTAAFANLTVSKATKSTRHFQKHTGVFCASLWQYLRRGMQVFYTPRYYAQIGEGHVFPIRKFELVRDRLLAEGTLDPSEIVEPSPAPLEDVLLVHTEDYVTRLCNRQLTTKEIRRLGLPWSESLVRRSFYAVGGTLAAAQSALANGCSSNLAGGTHHAFADRGEGFCVLNDVAIAIRALRARNS